VAFNFFIVLEYWKPISFAEVGLIQRWWPYTTGDYQAHVGSHHRSSQGYMVSLKQAIAAFNCVFMVEQLWPYVVMDAVDMI